jgi:hypothetical protein
MLKRKAPWHGLDSTARKNPSNNDYYTLKTVQGEIKRKISRQISPFREMYNGLGDVKNTVFLRQSSKIGTKGAMPCLGQSHLKL